MSCEIEESIDSWTTQRCRQWQNLIKVKNQKRQKRVSCSVFNQNQIMRIKPEFRMRKNVGQEGIQKKLMEWEWAYLFCSRLEKPDERELWSADETDLWRKNVLLVLNSAVNSAFPSYYDFALCLSRCMGL